MQWTPAALHGHSLLLPGTNNLFFLVASYARTLLTIIITISQGHLSYKVMMIICVQPTVVVFSNMAVLDYVFCAEVGNRVW